MSEVPLIVFLHIPKTAGSAFRAVIEKNVPVERRLELYRTNGDSLARGLWNARDNVPRATIALGHIEHRVHEFIERECRYFTVLRDPIDRVLSLYRFVKYDYPKHPLHKKLNTEWPTLDSWVDRWPRIATNVMTKMVSGLATEYEQSTPPMLDRALINLRRMPAVGVQERFNESIDHICAAFGWQALYPKVNESSVSRETLMEAEKIGPATIEKIRTINRLDLKLYEEALRLMDAQGSRAA